MIYGCADNRQLFEGTVGKEVKAMTVSKIFTELGLINEIQKFGFVTMIYTFLHMETGIRIMFLDTWIMKLNLLLGKMTTIFILILSKGCKL